MKMIDTLATSQVKVSVIDIRAGLLSPTLKTFTDVGFFDLVRAGEFNFGLFHVVGPSVASLDEIGDVLPYAGGAALFRGEELHQRHELLRVESRPSTRTISRW